MSQKVAHIMEQSIEESSKKIMHTMALKGHHKIALFNDNCFKLVTDGCRIPYSEKSDEYWENSIELQIENCKENQAYLNECVFFLKNKIGF